MGAEHCYSTNSSCTSQCELKNCERDIETNFFCCTEPMQTWQYWVYGSFAVFALVLIILFIWGSCYNKKRSQKYKKVLKTKNNQNYFKRETILRTEPPEINQFVQRQFQEIQFDPFVI
ncbi:Hypothetical_protein [Hexamita inflata]|uniref:Hypothetical_protein n=1 Tax=Hexamita inflata TaxID=28002 RepID=A0AA86Q2J5_9EUKA|nr:Hypothetical protein HINF_LOCUS38630 [Hexamita inflata]